MIWPNFMRLSIPFSYPEYIFSVMQSHLSQSANDVICLLFDKWDELFETCVREFAHCFYISSQLCFIWRRLGLDLQHAPVLETETGLGMAWISRKRWQMRQASTTMERRDASGAAYYEQWSEHGGGSYGDGCTTHLRFSWAFHFVVSFILPCWMCSWSLCCW